MFDMEELLEKENKNAQLTCWLFLVNILFLHMGLFLAIEAILENVPQGKKKVFRPVLS
jgi:hypothetical protein